MSITPKEVAKYIDHTILKANALESEVKKICEEALEYKFASVCVNPYYVPFVKEILKGSEVKVCTVVGFPLGATPKEVKAFEAIKAVADGAEEVDMVINIGAMKDKKYDYVEEDIRYVVNAVPEDVCVKVILETCYLTEEEVKISSELSKKAGAHFVKTSTGFGPGGATKEAIKIMRETVGEGLGVKASGGVRDFETAKIMIENGASRIGASASVNIVNE